MLHEVIIDELNKQIYSENEKMNRKSQPAGDIAVIIAVITNCQLE